MVYGTTLRLPGDFFSLSPASSTTVPDLLSYVDRLKSTMSRLTAVPPCKPSQNTPWVPIHVFIRQDGVRRSLQPPYTGPFTVIRHKPKHFIIQVKGQSQSVSIDRLKPAFLLEETPATVPRTQPLSGYWLACCDSATARYTSTCVWATASAHHHSRAHDPFRSSGPLARLSDFIVSCPCGTLGGSNVVSMLTFFCIFPYCLIVYFYFIISCSLAWLYVLHYSMHLIHILSCDPLYALHRTRSLLFLVCTHVICTWHKQCNYLSLYPRAVQRHGVESLASSRVVSSVSAPSSSPSEFPWTSIYK